MGVSNKLLVCTVMIVLMAHFVSSISEITVQETDIISLKLQAYDEDGDPLEYYFSPPLDSAGRWQTDYGDAGEYIADVTVSDGKTSTTQQIKLIVLEKNRPPKIENIKDLIAKEGDIIQIAPQATDYEGDDVSIRISPPIGNDGEWKTDYNSAGVYNITVIADDGQNEAVDSFTLTVLEVNRPPQIKSYQPETDVEISETDKLTLQIVANDLDYEDITYEWYIDGQKAANESRIIYQPGYNDAGVHQIKGAVSDGNQISAIYWNIGVINLNRPPVLKEISPITAKEGNLIKINPVAYDLDQDLVSLSYSEPFNELGEWQTTKDDSGVYEITVTASDGEFEESQKVQIIVENVDRKPIFSGEIEEIEVNEGDELDLTLGISDPDGDIIELTATGLPKGASLNGNKLTYKPDYSVIRKPDSWFASLLKKIHLDDLFYSDKETFKITLEANAKNLSIKKKIKLTVLDTNRAPVLKEMKDITMKENDVLVLKPQATDYDNDRISYKISLPVGDDGRWETDFEDNGIYDVVVTATDGELEDVQTIKVNVENVNRKPIFEELPVVVVNENEEAKISLKNKITDPDGDEIELSVENMPKGAVFENNVLTWQPDYDTIKTKSNSLFNRIWSKIAFFNRAYSSDKKDFTIKFLASDRESTVEEEAVIRVKNVNRLPKFTNIYPDYTAIAVKRNEPILFGAIGADPDNDTLSYTWKLGAFKSAKGTPVIRRTFTEPGDEKIKLILSDGQNSITKTWYIMVK